LKDLRGLTLVQHFLLTDLFRFRDSSEGSKLHQQDVPVAIAGLAGNMQIDTGSRP
jgi:hypothetical protein